MITGVGQRTHQLLIVIWANWGVANTGRIYDIHSHLETLKFILSYE